MNFKYILLALTFCFLITSCKKEVPVKEQKITLAISGMTCEIGCARTIQSKLSTKEGVLDAKVVFSDSLANISYNANKTSKADLIAFVGGIAGGELYSASEATESLKTREENKKSCTKKCMEKCDTAPNKKACCSEDENGKHVCKNKVEMTCCKKAV